MKKIFGIGLSRTGTTSLAHLLDSIGINIIHYPNEAELFNPQNAGACDIPVAAHYEELDVKFPNSKFIYTFRNKEEWLTSMEAYLKNKIERFKVTPWQAKNRKKIYGQIKLDRDHFNKKQFALMYDQHDKNIRNYFKNRPKDLLILDICGGDDPKLLFNFIGIDTKIKEFPHINKRI